MKLSIITATRNCAATVADCVASVCRQTHPYIEHLIIDGASTDDTLRIIRNAGFKTERRKRHGSRVTRIISEPDTGIYDAMNKGITLATGDVIGILNADDCYADPKVLARVAKLFKDPAVMSCYGDLVYVNGTGVDRFMNDFGFKIQLSRHLLFSVHSSPFKVVRYWKAGNFDPGRFYWGWMPPHPTFFVRRQLYERHGGFNLNLGSAADYELMLRFLLKQRISAAYIPSVLVAMRMGGASNVSMKNRLLANYMDRRAWKVNGLAPLPWTILCKPLRKLSQWMVKRLDP